MTIVEEPPARLGEPTAPDHAAPDDPAPTPVAAVEDERAPIRPVALAVWWSLITVVGVALVLIAVGPISEERDQRALLATYRTEIEAASNQAFGLGGVEVPTEAPAPGTPVAIVDIERIGVSRVVVEGTAPDQTRQGPGHVVGTGGPGQPGNSVIVGRRALFGGAFADLGDVRVDDRILVTTSQGRSVYTVEHVGTHEVVDATGTEVAAATAPTTSTPPVVAAADASEGATGPTAEDPTVDEPMLSDGTLAVEELYGPSPDDRLTLVTTASGTPGAAGEAIVVAARMDGQPFAPTPQGGRTPGNDGRSGSPGTSAGLILALLAYVAAVVGAIWLHRNVPWRSAYLLTAPVLVALTVVLAEQLASVLPAWT